MAILNILPPLISQTQPNFNSQTSQGFTAIQTWSSLIATSIVVDYIQSITSNLQSADFTTTSTSYVSIPNFTFNFTPKNPASIVAMKLTLKGIGYVGITVNGLLLREIPFNNLAFSSVDFNRTETFTTNSNKITLSLRSLTGTVSLACSKSEGFLNYLQITNINS